MKKLTQKYKVENKSRIFKCYTKFWFEFSCSDRPWKLIWWVMCCVQCDVIRISACVWWRHHIRAGHKEYIVVWTLWEEHNSLRSPILHVYIIQKSTVSFPNFFIYAICNNPIDMLFEQRIALLPRWHQTLCYY